MLFRHSDEQAIFRLVEETLKEFGEVIYKQHPDERSDVVMRRNNKFLRYDALHLFSKVGNIPGLDSKVEIPIEIQFTTIFRFAYFQLQHDTMYKDNSGQISSHQVKLLDILNGVSNVGEALAEACEETLQEGAGPEVFRRLDSTANLTKMAVRAASETKKQLARRVPDRQIIDIWLKEAIPDPSIEHNAARKKYEKTTGS